MNSSHFIKDVIELLHLAYDHNKIGHFDIKEITVLEDLVEIVLTIDGIEEPITIRKEVNEW